MEFYRHYSRVEKKCANCYSSFSAHTTNETALPISAVCRCVAACMHSHCATL